MPADTNAPAGNSPPLWPDDYLSKALAKELRDTMERRGWVPDNITRDGTARHLARSVMGEMIRARRVRLREALNTLDASNGSDREPDRSETQSAWEALWGAPAEIELLRDAMDR